MFWLGLCKASSAPPNVDAKHWVRQGGICEGISRVNTRKMKFPLRNSINNFIISQHDFRERYRSKFVFLVSQEKMQTQPLPPKQAGEATWSEATWANQRLICQFLAVNRDAETSCSSRRPHFSHPAASSECQYIFIHLSSTSALLSAPECHLHSQTHLNRAKTAETPIEMPKRDSSAYAPETVADNAVTNKSFLTHQIRRLDLCSKTSHRWWEQSER